MNPKNSGLTSPKTKRENSSQREYIPFGPICNLLIFGIYTLGPSTSGRTYKSGVDSTVDLPRRIP